MGSGPSRPREADQARYEPITLYMAKHSFATEPAPTSARPAGARDMIVTGPPGDVAGYAIAQPITALLEQQGYRTAKLWMLRA